jgi:D-tyrosyl-tRNA(Tyr) deacylase
MRAVLQRVTSASVTVGGKTVSEIGKGLLVLVGITEGDNKDDVDYITRKIVGTKMWDSEDKKWSRSIKDNHYEVLIVSQFTLYSVCKGNKLDFHRAMSSNKARLFFDDFVRHVQSVYMADKVKVGAFGEMMDVRLNNDGPVTVVIDSKTRNF